MSKYKNPDRFIERLKFALDQSKTCARENYSLYLKQLGEQIINWSDDSTDKISVTSQRFVGMRPGDTICRIDKVTKVVIEKESSYIEVEMIEIRKKG